jgi:hypothetical protein
LLVQVAGERIELLGPELLIALHPGRGGLHRLRRQLAADHPALLGARDQAGFLQHPQVLHEAGQRHLVLVGQLGDLALADGERLQHVAPRAVGQRGEHRVEVVV